MSILIHCENCNKSIKAPDSAGGKYGKCPFCQHRNYIPLPEAKDEGELRLVPLDDDEIKNKQKMMLETYSLTQQLLGEKEVPNENNQSNSSTFDGNGMPERQLLGHIVKYLANMAHSNLDVAQDILKEINPYKVKACDLLDRLLKAGAAEKELADISPTILKGLINNLKNLLK